MDNKLYVGNLAWATTNESLAAAFAQAGTVLSGKVVFDRETNRSKGFGFVEMATAEEAQKAIDLLNGKDLDGRAIKVNFAKPREEGAQRRPFRPRGASSSRQPMNSF